ncbi:nucleoside hydrolase [Candidatus Woesearchaeota archaeon]|nr:nucleoside hydrolase [Candidatus Woesearchaeota archaeon]
MKPYKIILDTDIGTDVDDAYAQLFAMRSPEISIQAITTVYGDTGLRAKISKKMAKLEGYEVPVAAGEEKPMTPHNGINKTGYEGQGFLDAKDLDERLEDAGIEDDAVDLIIRKIKENPDETYIVAIGPLTNIAKALERDPSIGAQIKGLYAMGGCFRYPEKLTLENMFEHKNAIQEYNIVCDLTAAKKVFASGIPITLVPLDITTQVKWSKTDLEELARKKDELSKGLANMTDIWFMYKTMMHRTRMDATSMHDPLTVAALFDPSLVKKKKAHVSITEEGVTVAEDREGTVEICYEVDSERFEKMLRERILPNSKRNLAIKIIDFITNNKLI